MGPTWEMPPTDGYPIPRAQPAQVCRMTFSALKQQFENDFGPRREDDFGLRVIRSIRWGMRAETAMVEKDHDAAFIFYWIAFNAAYSEYHEQTSRERERRLFEVFLGKIFAFDGDEAIGNAMSQRLQSRIERFLGTKYVFQPFLGPQSQGRIATEQLAVTIGPGSDVGRPLASSAGLLPCIEATLRAPVRAAQSAIAWRRGMEQFDESTASGGWSQHHGGHHADNRGYYVRPT